MKLFCNHNYKNMCRSAGGIWSIFECIKCGKLSKGGMPRTKIKMKPPPVKEVNNFVNGFGWSLVGLEQLNPESKKYIGKKSKKKRKKK